MIGLTNYIFITVEGVDPKSMHAITLKTWMDENDPNALACLLGGDAMVTIDWVIMALSAMNGEKSSSLVARAFAMRFIQKGDLHTAVVLLLALGDKTGAIEIYVSHKHYL